MSDINSARGELLQRTVKRDHKIAGLNARIVELQGRADAAERARAKADAELASLTQRHQTLRKRSEQARAPARSLPEGLFPCWATPASALRSAGSGCSAANLHHESDCEASSTSSSSLPAALSLSALCLLPGTPHSWRPGWRRKRRRCRRRL